MKKGTFYSLMQTAPGKWEAIAKQGHIDEVNNIGYYKIPHTTIWYAIDLETGLSLGRNSPRALAAEIAMQKLPALKEYKREHQGDADYQRAVKIIREAGQ